MLSALLAAALGDGGAGAGGEGEGGVNDMSQRDKQSSHLLPWQQTSNQLNQQQQQQRSRGGLESQGNQYQGQAGQVGDRVDGGVGHMSDRSTFMSMVTPSPVSRTPLNTSINLNKPGGDSSNLNHINLNSNSTMSPSLLSASPQASSSLMTSFNPTDDRSTINNNNLSSTHHLTHTNNPTFQTNNLDPHHQTFGSLNPSPSSSLPSAPLPPPPTPMMLMKMNSFANNTSSANITSPSFTQQAHPPLSCLLNPTPQQFNINTISSSNTANSTNTTNLLNYQQQQKGNMQVNQLIQHFKSATPPTTNTNLNNNPPSTQSSSTVQTATGSSQPPPLFLQPQSPNATSLNHPPQSTHQSQFKLTSPPTSPLPYQPQRNTGQPHQQQQQHQGPSSSMSIPAPHPPPASFTSPLGYNISKASSNNTLPSFNSNSLGQNQSAGYGGGGLLVPHTQLTQQQHPGAINQLPLNMAVEGNQFR
eukprot:GHVN01040947.1.p1 GENE.GHVN01040947.1~~GHVN01040947.1.p1  ORF type:complete len:473 (-),score=143.17 GHVN01040947.1:93-1511(-)